METRFTDLFNYFEVQWNYITLRGRLIILTSPSIPLQGSVSHQKDDGQAKGWPGLDWTWAPPTPRLVKQTYKVKTICLLCKSILKMPQNQVVVPRTSQTEVLVLPLQKWSCVYSSHVPFQRTVNSEQAALPWTCATIIFGQETWWGHKASGP